MEQVECVVVGAGVVGLAVARVLALAGREVIVLECAEAIGTQTSSRNSEVIHAGIYYPQGSLKARLCVSGRKQLYHYCKARGIAHRRCGKLIVASSEQQVPDLLALRKRALDNDVPDLTLLSAAEARALEPALDCAAALWSPSTGIIDSHELMLALQGDAENAGAMVVLCTPVTGGHIDKDRIVLDTGEPQATRLAVRYVVNAAGLQAHTLASRLRGFDPAQVPSVRYARGNYYAMTGKAPFSRLIYPIPEAAGLGVHLTVDLAGQARFGPDVEWIDRIDYQVDPARADGFYKAIRRYWPAIPDGVLQPAYAGIRPKLTGPGQAAADFVIQGPETHGIAGLVNLFGIESPGLTASLAIADRVSELLSP